MVANVNMRKACASLYCEPCLSFHLSKNTPGTRDADNFGINVLLKDTRAGGMNASSVEMKPASLKRDVHGV